LAIRGVKPVAMADKSKQPPAPGGPNVVSFGDADRALRRRKGRDDPPPATPRGGAPPGKWTPNDIGLPREDPCPVEPLGFEGELYHLIDSHRQFRSRAASDFSHAGIQALFGATPNYPQWMCPRYGRAAKAEPGEEPKPPPIKSFEDDKVRELIFAACARKGLFSPTDKLRGRGAWKLRGGALVYHAGEEVWTMQDGRLRELAIGMHEEFLYPRLAPLPAPWNAAVSSADLGRSVGALLDTFRRWNWERPKVDPVLLLGWVGVAFLGGALDWRPALLLLGDKGTGKSTLQDGLKAVFGDALFHSADTTAAGIYQRMAHDARPVALDELEPGADPRKIANVVQLMRDASSGAMGRRGGSDGAPAEFQMRSAFLFSAINNPVTKSQDLSRMAILRLRPLDRNQPMPAPIDEDITGRICLTRMMAEWPKFETSYEAFARALDAGGHDARGQRTYGTLLACAELLLGPELAAALDVPLTEAPEFWAEELAADKLPEVEDAMSNWRACLTWLLTAEVQVWRHGARRTIGQALRDLERDNNGAGGTFGIEEARRELELTGVGILPAGDVVGIEHGPVLAIPNSSPLVAKLFEGTDWQGAPGAGGPWKDALRQAPATIAITDKAVNRVYIAGVRQRCTLIVLKNFHQAPER
jgi:hypothetical protein